MTVRILVGDVREQLKTLPDESVHCIVTSPILIELNPSYADMARRRIAGDAPLFSEVA